MSTQPPNSDIWRPIEPFQLTQGFGENPDAYKRFGLAGHNGWDLKTKYPDTPNGHRSIFASWLSKFYKSGNEGNDGFGLYFEVIVELFNTYKLTYAHCDSFEHFVEKKEGISMGISDNTGNSSGPHLHLTVKRGSIINNMFQSENYNNGYFGAINPQIFFDELREYIKKYGRNPISSHNPIMVQVEDTTYAQLVDGATRRKEVAEYLGIPYPDSDKASTEEITSKIEKSINAYKGQASQANSRAEQAGIKLAAANTEVENRTIQVRKLEDKLLDQEEIHKKELEAVKNSTPNCDELVSIWKTKAEENWSKYDAESKERGRIEIKLSTCKAGSPVEQLSVADVLVLLFNKLKEIKLK